MTKYEKERITITLDKNIISKLDKVKLKPFWKGNRSKVVEFALEKLFEVEK